MDKQHATCKEHGCARECHFKPEDLEDETDDPEDDQY
jgi:hypothetical protein